MGDVPESLTAVRRWMPRGEVVKAAVLGGVAASLVTGALFMAKPASSSATVLLPSLGTIIQQITTYYNLMLDYVDQWAPGLGGLINDEIMDNSLGIDGEIRNAISDAMDDQAAYHAQGGSPYYEALSDQLSEVRGSDGRIDPEAAVELLAPTGPLSGTVNDADLNRVWSYSKLLVGDQPLPQVSPLMQDTLEGTQYEYKRVQVLQHRMLAQDAVQQYPLSGPMLEGYQKHLGQLEDTTTISSMKPGQLLAAQLDVMTNVMAPVALANLESSLRQERLLGALIGREVQQDVAALEDQPGVTQ